MRWHGHLLVGVAMGVLALVACKASGQMSGVDAGIDRPDDIDTKDGSDVADAQQGVKDAGGPSDAAGGDLAAATAACRAAIESQCRRQVVCRGGDMASCVSRVIDRCPDYYFNSRSRRTVAEIESCLVDLGSMSCTDIVMNVLPPCLRQGTGLGGSSCLYATECEFGCVDGFSRCGTCATLTWAATGEACDATHACAPADYCHMASKRCTPKSSVVHAAEGASCDFAAQPSVGCQGDLVCARTTTTGTAGICRPYPQLDRACANGGDLLNNGWVCAAGLSCDSQTMTCRTPPLSETCGDAGACDDASFCRSASGGASASCIARAPAGQACRITPTTSGPEIECALGLRCVTTPDAGYDGTCTALGHPGDPCDATHPCANSLCGVSGRCGAFAPAACQ